METGKLYYEDCHLTEFSARVLACEQTDQGFAVELDATAFYPEGGGQACDTGTLGGSRVLDVREREDRVIHLCDRPLTVGETVQGRIDWERRFDLMQQHTGEHIVSGIFHRRFGVHNVGFHMGAQVVTIDFDGVIPAQALPEVEAEANGALWQNLPVNCWYPSPEELPEVTYRTKKALPWPVRIVEIPGFDRCACCGVHVAATGEVGLVKLLSCVKFHQGVRIEMVCGARAVELLSRIYEQNRQVSQLLSAKPLETGEAAQRLQDTLGAEKLRCATLQKRLFDAIAKSYAGQEHVLHMEEGLSPAEVRLLAEKLAGVCTGVAAVVSGGNVCLARPGGDVKALAAEMTQTLRGRGGGKAGFFQGSLQAGEEEIRAFFQRAFS